jgi:hypothetical protein
MGDLPAAEQAQWAARLGRTAVGTCATPATAIPGWVRVPSTYVHTLRDDTTPLALQKHVVGRAREHAAQIAGEEGRRPEDVLVPFGDAELGVVEVDAAHNVMLSQTEFVKGLLVKIVARLEKEH